MTTLPPPTPDLAPLAQALGREGLLTLLEKRGGTRLPVPSKVGASKLVDELGVAIAAALVEHWGGLVLKVPLGRTWRVEVLRAQGLSYADIATRVGLTEDGVWRILRTSGLTGERRRRPLPDAFEPPAQYDLLAWMEDDR